jgi:hypothetical protein
VELGATLVNLTTIHISYDVMHTMHYFDEEEEIKEDLCGRSPRGGEPR